MQLIVLAERHRIQRAVHFGPLTLILLAILVLTIAGGSFWLGHQSKGGAVVVQDLRPELYAAAMREELHQQKSVVDNALGGVHHDLNALALQLSDLQARAIRIDALGMRLAQLAGVDTAEFSFGESPARGGAAPSGEGAPHQIVDFVAALKDLSRTLESRTHELEALEASLLSGRLQARTLPSGVPSLTGWISSTFGERNDPLTGARSIHNGVDFAGKLGSPIISVAAGIVAFSGVRSGFGNVVEVDHGNGYLTRYAHNLENLVSRGQRVKKGETVAKLGSSGRSTGNHVHFEVLKNGKHLDPMTFIRAER